MDAVLTLKEEVQSVSNKLLHCRRSMPSRVFRKDTQQKINNNETISPSLINAIHIHETEFNEILNLIEKLANSLYATFSEISKQFVNDSYGKHEQTMCDFEQANNKLSFALNAVEKLKQNYLPISFAINDKIVMGFQNKTSKSLSASNVEKLSTELKAFMELAEAERQNNKSTIRSLQSTYDHDVDVFRKSFEEMKKEITNRQNCLIQLTKFYGLFCEELGTSFKSYADKVLSLVEQIEVKTEFKTILHHKQIARYDISFPAFKPIMLDPNIFKDPVSPIPESRYKLVPKPPMCSYFPMFVGKSLYSFNPTADYEVPMKKNQLVLILEPPKDDWTLTMDKNTHKVGFVPSSFVKVLGKGVGICTNSEKQQEWEVQLNTGDFIALKAKYTSEGKFSVVKTDETEGFVALDSVAIIAGDVDIF